MTMSLWLFFQSLTSPPSAKTMAFSPSPNRVCSTIANWNILRSGRTLSKILFFQEFFWMSLIMDSKAYLVGCCHFYRSETWNLQEALKIALNHLKMASEFFYNFQNSWEINHTKVLGNFFNVKPTLECVLEQQCKKSKVQVC